MNWAAAARIDEEGTTEHRIFTALSKLETTRRKEQVFSCAADVWTIETGDRAVLGIGRYLNGETLVGLFNFSEVDRAGCLNDTAGYIDLMTGETRSIRSITVPAQGFFWLKKF